MRLSSIQNAIWVTQNQFPESVLYNIGGYATMQGELDVPLLVKSIHVVLSIPLFGDYRLFLENELSTEVKEPMLSVQIHDLTDKSAPLAYCDAYMESEMRRPFSTGQVVRCHIFKISISYHVWFLKAHHIVFDGFSMSLFFNSVCEVYGNGGSTTVACGKWFYSEFSKFESERASTSAFKAARASYIERLKSLPVSRAFGSIIISPDVHASLKSKRKEFKVSQSLIEKVTAFCDLHQCTVYHYFIAVIHAVNMFYDGDAFVLTLAGHNRVSKKFRNTLGVFVNTCPFYLPEGIGDKTFPELLRSVRDQVKASYRHQGIGLIDCIEEAGVSADFSNTMFSYQKNVYSCTIPGVSIDIRYLHNGEQLHDLSFHLLEYSNSGERTLAIDYKHDLSTDNTIELLMTHLENAIRIAFLNPTIAVKKMCFLDDHERDQLIEDFNNNHFELSPLTFVDLFEQQVSRSPQAEALRFGDRSVTYSELNLLSNQFGHFLVSSCSVRPAELIGVCLHRSEWLVVALLGILKAGATYVPIDPDYPESRIQYMLTDSQCRLQINSKVLADFIESRSEYFTSQVLVDVSGGNAAYVIYTSGSTGNPKGVVITHDNMSSFIQWCTKEFYNSPFDLVLGVTSICFDLSIFEIFYTLSAGKVLRLLDNALAIPDVNDQERILLNTVPSVVSNLLESNVDVSRIKVLNMAGEPIPLHIIEQLDLRTIEVRNLYGPSETTTYSTCHRIESVGKILIGKPIANTEIFLVNRNLELVPMGAAGEICISGAGLASGYLGKTELTLEKFVDCPFLPGKKMYRTGDLGRHNSDGVLEFLGRRDEQVKIRGYRIETGEVETVIKNIAHVSACVVSAYSFDGDVRLVGYVVGDEALSIPELEKELSARLPLYMLPSQFIQLQQIPRTPNGKVDKKALPRPGDASLKARTPEPRSATEEQLAMLWSEVLRIKHSDIAPDDNFFLLGGHSLRASRLAASISSSFDLRLPLFQLFDHPTLREQAILISRTSQKRQFVSPTRTRLQYATSSAQKRLWLLSHLPGASRAYNMSACFSLEGDLKISDLEASFMMLIEHHEIFRTVFRQNDRGEIDQCILPADRVEKFFYYHDLRHVLNSDTVLREIVSHDGAIEFRLDKGPLFRVSLIHFQPGKFVLNMVMHHIITDGWSLEIMIKEVGEIYRASGGNVQGLSALELQYKDYSHWELEQLTSDGFAEHRGYWMQQMSGTLPVMNLPFSRPRPPLKTYNGNTFSTFIGQEELSKLKQIASTSEVTLFMTLVTIVKTLLYRYSGQEDSILGVPVAGREFPELQNQMGLYVNTLPLRLNVSGADTFQEILSKVRKVALDGYKYQAFPFNEIVNGIRLPRDTSRSPIFDVMVLFQEQGIDRMAERLELEGVKVSSYDTNLPMQTKFDLTFDFAEAGDGLLLRLEYNSDLYALADIKSCADRFRILVNSIISSPDQPISKYDFLDNDELELLEVTYNSTHVEYEQKSMVEMFALNAVDSPEKMAVRYADKVMTYGELHEWSTRFANFMVLRYNIQTEDLVGVMIARSHHLIGVLLGILKAGASYVPIDVSYPKARIDYITSDSQCRVVVDENVVREFLTEFEKYLDTDVPRPLNLDQTAYVIYTSGSTGQPKGVMISHRSVSWFIQWCAAEFSEADFETVFAVTSICFDLSVYEIFYTLAVGKPITLLDDALSIQQHLKTAERVLLNTVPSVIARLLSVNTDLSNVSVLNMAGEPIPDQVIQGLDYDKMEVRNLYGPSETTTYSTIYRLSKPSPVLIGRPIANTQIYLTDQHLQLVSHGAIGEICISGAGVAKGYLGKEDLTKEKFVTSPFRKGERIYKTGDLGRWLPNGELQFLGRKDEQVKIRGYRIEIAEIQRALGLCECVTSSVVVAKMISADSIEQDLCAYVVSDNAIDRAQLIRSLAAHLPGYMIPTYIVQLDALPLTPNGKIDKKALPLPVLQIEKSTIVKPRNEIELGMALIWSEILALDPDKISVNDDFFILGGHSLKAIQVIARIRDQFNVELSFKDVLDHTDIEGISALVERSAKPINNVPIKRVARSSYKLN